MTSIWAEILDRNMRQAFGLMEQQCAPHGPVVARTHVGGPRPGRWQRGAGAQREPRHGPAARRALVQLYATPWAVAWYAVERLDFMLNGGFVPWEIWPGFRGRTGWTSPPVRSVWESPYGGLDATTLSEPRSRADLLGFIEYCHQRVTDTLSELTDERATTRIGSRSEPYAARLIDNMGHVIEHGSQIRQFITGVDRGGGTPDDVS